MIGESAQSELPGGGVQNAGPNFGLGRFLQKLQGPLLNVAQRILGDPIEAEDVTIEVLARLLPRLQEFDSEGHFAAYARASVRNAAVDRARQRSFRDARRALRDTDSIRRRRPDDEHQPTDLVADALPGAEEQLDADQQRKSVKAAVDSLGEPKRTVVTMFYEQDCSYAEIGATLGVSTATVKRHLGAARVLLARRLHDLKRRSHDS